MLQLSFTWNIFSKKCIQQIFHKIKSNNLRVMFFPDNLLKFIILKLCYINNFSCDLLNMRQPTECFLVICNIFRASHVDENTTLYRIGVFSTSFNIIFTKTIRQSTQKPAFFLRFSRSFREACVAAPTSIWYVPRFYLSLTNFLSSFLRSLLFWIASCLQIKPNNFVKMFFNSST